MPEYFCTLTDVGEGKIAQAALLGLPLSITHIAVGSGNPQELTPGPDTRLVDEKYRAPVGAVYSPPEDQSVVIVEMAIPVTVGGWAVNEIEVIDGAGDVIAVANYPETWKPVVTDGTGRVLLIRVMIDVGSADHVELLIDPAMVMATRQYVDNSSAAVASDAEDAYLAKSKNLSDLADKPVARTNLDVYSKAECDARYLDESNNLSDLTDKPAARTNLDVYSKTEGDARYLEESKNLSDLPSKPVARTNLDVYSKAECDARYLDESNNLSDLADKPAARTNLDVYSKTECDARYLDESSNLSDLPDKVAARNNLGVPKNTVLKGRTGWHLDADTGLLKQWGTTGLLGDFPGSAVIRSFTFPMAFTGGVNFVHPITRQYAAASTAASTITHAVIHDPTETGFQLITSEYDGNVQSYGIDWYAEGFI